VASINGRTIEFVLGDITQQAVDAIVNAANSRLEAAAVSMVRSTARAGRPLWGKQGGAIRMAAQLVRL
jgi:hypothetical protein